MINNQKPQEFWIERIRTSTNGCSLNSEGLLVRMKPHTSQLTIEEIHVIEKSAYDELLNSKITIEGLRGKEIKTVIINEDATLLAENNKLRAQLSECLEALAYYADDAYVNRARLAKELLARLTKKDKHK